MAHVPVTVKKKPQLDHDIHKFQGKESFLTSQIELYVEEAHPKIPDGGWGWMVVLAAFILNTISEGVSFSFGLLYSEFLVEFEASKSATSWIGSLFIAMPLLAGPIGSALVNKYGCISMTIVGSLVCTSGFIMSVYVKSLTIMYITFGVIGGVGRCLTFVTAVVSIAFWFEKKRTIALGLAASGAGFGTIVFPPLTNWLLNEYHWRGTLLNLSGFFLNMCVCGVIMRDPDWIKEEEQEKKTPKGQAASTNTTGGQKKDEVHVLIQNSQGNIADRGNFRSAVDLPTYLKDNEKVPLEVLKRLSENKRLSKVVNIQNLLKSKSSSEDFQEKNWESTDSKVQLKLSKIPEPTQDTIPEVDENEANIDAKLTTKTPLIRSFSFTPQSKSVSNSYLHNIKMKKHSLGPTTDLPNFQKHKVTTSCPTVYGNELSVEKKDGEKWYGEFLEILRQSVDFSLFGDFHFFLLAFSIIILFTWFVVPYFYLVEHMVEIGYSDSQASFALSLIGVTNTIGMIFFGWAGEKVNIAKTYAVCLILCGISVASIMFFAHNYWLLLISTALFGLFFASCFSLVPSLLTQLVTLDEFTMAYGLILLCEGIGNLMGPPLAGLLYDLTRSWDLSFYKAAIWIIVSGVLVGMIPYTKNRRMFGKITTPVESR